MTQKSWEQIYTELSAEFPEEAVERTKSVETRKGYDTTGYKYQYIVNRFNEVLGVNGWSYKYEEAERINGTTKNGYPMVSVTVDLTIALLANGETISKPHVGAHESRTYGDAKKGAITNAFKKCAAMYGVGKKAYEGTIDDDNEKLDEPMAPQATKAPDVMSDDFVSKLAANTPFQGCMDCGGPLSAKLGKNGKPYCARFCFDPKNHHLQDAWRAEKHMDKMEDQAMKYGEPKEEAPHPADSGIPF